MATEILKIEHLGKNTYLGESKEDLFSTFHLSWRDSANRFERYLEKCNALVCAVMILLRASAHNGDNASE